MEVLETGNNTSAVPWIMLVLHLYCSCLFLTINFEDQKSEHCIYKDLEVVLQLEKLQTTLAITADLLINRQDSGPHPKPKAYTEHHTLFHKMH